MKRLLAAILLVLLAGFPTRTRCGEPETLIRETFADLDAWRPVEFPKIPAHTTYTIVADNGDRVLQAEARASASGLAHKARFDVRKFPILSWRWKTEGVLKRGDATRKDGDDYAIRVYVVFTYDPARAGTGMRLKYALAARLYGEYPPHAALNYIWANRDHGRRILPSPYTDRSMMVVLRSGDTEAGRWLEERVNIPEDYRAAFGEEPPAEAAIVIMSDSDNTGESVRAYLDDITLCAAPDVPDADRDGEAHAAP